MAYIGKSPVIGNFVKLDAITAVNGQAAYTMQNGGSNFTDYESVNQFLVSLNGTIQAPTDSFTVSGSTLTFASNLSTGDVIDFIMVFGNSLSAGTPTDGTVTTAKLADSSVTSAKIGSGTISLSGGGFKVEDGYAYGFGDNSYRIEGKDDGANARIGFVTGDSEIARFTTDGLTFNGDTAAANALDDYEEGTWTPTIKISGSTTGITYSVQSGHYTKIGNRVIANAEIALSAKGSNTGNVSMIGLPLTTSNDNYQTAHVYNDRVSSPNGDVQAYVLTNGTSINFYQSRTDGTNNGNLTGNEMNATSYLIRFMTYKTDA